MRSSVSMVVLQISFSEALEALPIQVEVFLIRNINFNIYI